MSARRSSLLVRAGIVSIVALGAACSFMHSLDGFSDEYGAEPETGIDVTEKPDVPSEPTDTTAPPPDAGADVPLDAGPDVRPDVKCDLEVITTVSGADAADNFFMNTLAVAKSYVYFGSFEGDASVVRRVAKSTNGTGVVATGLALVRGCVAHSNDVACAIGTRVVLFPLRDAGGVRTLLEAKEPLTDVTRASDGMFAFTRSGGGGAWFTPWSPDDASVRRTTISPEHAVVDDEAGLLLLSGPVNEVVPDAAPKTVYPLVAYPRAAWDDPDASRDAAPDGCVVYTDRVLQLGTARDNLLWITPPNSNDLFQAPLMCGTSPGLPLGGTYFAVAADDRFVFLQSDTQVELRWADKITDPPACTASSPNLSRLRATQIPAFDGDSVWFLAPPHLMRLNIAVTAP